MKKIILFIALMTTTLSFAQTSKAEIAHIIKEQSDGIPGQKSYMEGVSTAYNDGKQAVSTVYNNVKSLSPKVESAIKSLATGLKTTTNALWVILVRQQLVWSICFLILTLSALFNWYLFYKRTQIIPKNITYITLKRNMIGNVVNPKYDSYYKDRTDDIRSQMYVDGVIGEEEYSCPQNPHYIETPLIQDLFKYLHLIICIGLSGLSIYHFSDMLTGFINPEFGALKTIVEVATKLK